MRLSPLIVLFFVIFPLSAFSSNNQVITIERKDGKEAVFYKFEVKETPRSSPTERGRSSQYPSLPVLAKKKPNYDPNALDTRGMDIKNTVKYIPIRKRTKRTGNGKSTKGHEIKASRGIILRIAPNPFSKEVLISYSLPKSAYVNICVYDLSGRKVRTLIEGSQIRGVHRLSWNGCDDHGQMLPSGYYFCEAKVSGRKITRKILKLY